MGNTFQESVVGNQTVGGRDPHGAPIWCVPQQQTRDSIFTMPCCAMMRVIASVRSTTKRINGFMTRKEVTRKEPLVPHCK